MNTEIQQHQSFNYTLPQIKEMANYVCASGLFPGITTPEAAVTLMMLCQAENLHPIKATQRYHIIKGKPAMKADAMLGEFQSKGGKVQWLKWDDDCCKGVFFAPGIVDGIEVEWTMERANKANLTSNPTWKSYPRNMLRARVISDGVRMCMPAIIAGIYTPEEVNDFVEVKKSVIGQYKEIPCTEIEEIEVNSDTLDNIINKIDDAKNLSELNQISELIKSQSTEIRNMVREHYVTKLKTLKGENNEV
jgi:hypothetical protein